MPADRLLFLLGSIVAAASLARAAAVSRSGAALGARWSGPERRANCRQRDDHRRTLVWALLAGLVLVAGILRVTGAVELIAGAARQGVRDLGWYGGRRPWQLAATAAAAAAVLGLAVAVARSRRAHRRQRLAVAAAAVMVGLLAVRAISWHDAGAVLATRVHGVRAGSLAEGGVVVVLVVAGLIGARTGRRLASPGSPPSEGPVAVDRAAAGTPLAARPPESGQLPAVADASAPDGSGATV